jgi:hypothetical protein
VARYDRADVTAVRDIFVETSVGKVITIVLFCFLWVPAQR